MVHLLGMDKAVARIEFRKKKLHPVGISAEMYSVSLEMIHLLSVDTARHFSFSLQKSGPKGPFCGYHGQYRQWITWISTMHL